MADEGLGFVEFHERDPRDGVHLWRPGRFLTLCGVLFTGAGFFSVGPLGDDTPEPSCEACLREAGWL